MQQVINTIGLLFGWLVFIYFLALTDLALNLKFSANAFSVFLLMAINFGADQITLQLEKKLNSNEPKLGIIGTVMAGITTPLVLVIIGVAILILLSQEPCPRLSCLY